MISNPIFNNQASQIVKRVYGKWIVVVCMSLILLAVGLYLVLSPKSNNQSHPTPTPSVLPSVSPTLPTSPPTISPTATPTTTPTPTPTPPSPTPSVSPIIPTSIPLAPEISWGNRSIKQVIFTFDAGSGNQSINGILSTLAHFKVEGSFFITGQWANEYPNDLRRIASAGHAIYNHTYTHPHLKEVSNDTIIEELQKTDKLVQSIVGFDTKPFFRAPYGERDSRILAIAASQGYRHVYWTVDAWDWKEGITAQEVKDRILNNVQPGTIYLMHVGDVITGQILPEVFQVIRDRGFAINSLVEGIK